MPFQSPTSATDIHWTLSSPTDSRGKACLLWDVNTQSRIIMCHQKSNKILYGPWNKINYNISESQSGSLCDIQLLHHLSDHGLLSLQWAYTQCYGRQTAALLLQPAVTFSLFTLLPNNTTLWQRQKGVNNMPKVVKQYCSHHKTKLR